MTGKINHSSFQRLRINLRQLEVFLATARSGSTRAAADRIARSQSAASTSLAELEAELGVELFDRIGRRLHINENGRALLPKAQVLVDQAAELQALFRMKLRRHRQKRKHIGERKTCATEIGPTKNTRPATGK